MYRWDEIQNKSVINPKVDDFLEEIKTVCKKHGFSIAHEDVQGGFIIENYNSGNIHWLMEASISIEN